MVIIYWYVPDGIVSKYKKWEMGIFRSWQMDKHKKFYGNSLSNLIDKEWFRNRSFEYKP